VSAALAQNIHGHPVSRSGHSRGSGLRLLLFTLECALGVVAVILVAAALTHWSPRLLPVAALLYLLIVVPTALWCGFWQAVIVSLSAVVAQSWFSAHHPELSMAANPATSVTLLVFVLVALTVSRLSARVTNHAREAESRGGQMDDLYEFTRRTLQMNLHVEPGPQLAELVHEIFDLEAVAVFDADLHDVYTGGILERGPAGDGPERLLLRNLGRRSGDWDRPSRGAAGIGALSGAWWCAGTPAL
jgi:K+-sensing histidine kinase KdpD